jgi:hypothetical protein
MYYMLEGDGGEQKSLKKHSLGGESDYIRVIKEQVYYAH